MWLIEGIAGCNGLLRPDLAAFSVILMPGSTILVWWLLGCILLLSAVAVIKVAAGLV